MNETTRRGKESDDKGTVVKADLNRVMELLPHRYPMLLIDGMTDIVAGESAVGIKNVTANEPFFQGHFPGHPVMPGVLIVEAMAQTSAALVSHTMGGIEGKVVYFMTVDRARFRHPVVPGDVLHIPVKKIRSRGPVWKFEGRALVGDRVVADAEYSAMIYG
jgi:3-hydroxyacyl-[acyl-carrier-protein] dehydratase